MACAQTLISIVTPVLNEEENVANCYQAIRRIFEDQLPDFDYEHIFSDNASADNTVRILKEIAADDRRVRLIINSRNFGLFCSMFNGLMHTRGDAVVVLFPADLQDPPELIPRFVAKWQEGYEVVYGIKKNREERWLMRTARKVYYRLVSRFANIAIPVDVSEFQLVDRAIVEALSDFDDYYPYVRGMIATCGFRATGIEYTWKARAHGRTKHRLSHLVDQGLNGLISFTKVPMRLGMALGLAISLLSLSYSAVSLIVNYLYFRTVLLPGIQSLIVAVFFFAGLQLMFFGVLGEYIAAIHFQVRRRPRIIVRETVNFDRDSCGANANEGLHVPRRREMARDKNESRHPLWRPGYTVAGRDRVPPQAARGDRPAADSMAHHEALCPPRLP